MTAPLLGELIEKMTGLALDRGGINKALDRFVADRMRALGLTMVESYVSLAADPNRPEQRKLIDAITVPHTWFYRDPEQLRVIAGLLQAAPAGPLAIWVAGCATGEEAYTLAMIGRRIGRELWVLATDVNETALAAARRGVYSALSVRDVPEAERHWVPQRERGFVVDDALRSAVRFQRHNLVDPPPQAPRTGWDLVVCRNVLIYFAPTAARRLLARFARAVREGGALVVGASEVVFEPPPGLELVSAENRLVLRRPTRPPPMRAEPRGTPNGLRPLPRAEARAELRSEPRLEPRKEPRLEPRLDARPEPRAEPRPEPRTEPRPEARPEARPAPADPVIPPHPRLAPQDIPPVPDPADRLADDDLVPELHRGHALFEHGDIAAAIEIYDAIVRTHPSIAEPWLFLGIARYAHGDVEEAAAALRASLCLDSALWPAGFYLARAYERLGRRADALQQYDLIAIDDLQPFSLQSTSAVINELRAFRHDFRNAARRLSAERTWPPRRPLR
ncbi:MAG TPA: CheR family methyltransferase [Kofleriaceae bacterium]|nr:CheR family methyltransferase [Kofleriaceae bacterium]